MIQAIHRITTRSAAAALLALAGLAHADAPGRLPGPASGNTENAQVSRSVHTSTSQQFVLRDASGQTVEVRVVDGEVFVKVNGKPTRTLNLSDDWERVTVRAGDDDRAVATVIKAEDGSGVAVISGDGTNADLSTVRGIRLLRPLAGDEDRPGLADIEALRPLRLLDAFGDDFLVDPQLAHVLRLRGEAPGLEGLATRATPPRTMLGITMAERGGEAGVLISSVVPDTPASKAGLQTGDLILEVEPDGPASAELVRRITRDATPGESITLKIKRGDETKEIVVELAPYDGSVFGIGQRFDGLPGDVRFRIGDGGFNMFDIERHTEEQARLQASMQRLLAEVAAQRATLESQVAEDMSDRMRVLSRELEEAMKIFSENQLKHRIDGQLFYSLRPRVDGEGEIVIGRGNGDQARIFARPARPSAPPAPVSPAAPSEQRIQSIESRLDALEASNQRIEQMLQTLMEQLAQRD